MPKIDFGSIAIYIGFVILLIIAIWLFVIKFSATAKQYAEIQLYEKPTWLEETEGDT